MNVIGLDVSTKTGIARIDGSLTRIVLRTAPAETGRRLHELRSRLSEDLRRYPPTPTLAVMEAASLGGPGVSSKITLGQLRAVVLELLFALDVAVVEVTPTALKRYATGNGKAEKPQMIAAAEHEGATPRTDDEADAFFCRHLGLVAYGVIPPTSVVDREQARHLTAARFETVGAMDWPKIT